MAPKPHGRVLCCVPGCKRTAPADHGFSEWVCSKHWPLVRKDIRRVKNRAHRRLAKQAALATVEQRDGQRWLIFGSREEWREYQRLKKVADAAWARAKREAIEAAMGI